MCYLKKTQNNKIIILYISRTYNLPLNNFYPGYTVAQRVILSNINMWFLVFFYCSYTVITA